MLSIVIPCRNEPLLTWTIRNIWRTADVLTEIIVVDDATNPTDRDIPAEIAGIAPQIPIGHRIKILRNEIIKGVGKSRNLGIHEASCDAVLILDAHMDFESSTWASDMVAWLAKNQTSIACTRCARLAHGRLAMEDASGVQEGGAYIQERQVTSSGEQRLLQGVWSRNPETIAATREGKPAPISCMMGAAYLMSRMHYIYRLRSPWAHLNGWGVAEPTICIVQAMMGYQSWLLPITIGHVFRTGEQVKKVYTVPHDDVRYNQYLLATIVYDDPERLAIAYQFMSGFGTENILMRIESSGGMEYAKWVQQHATINITDWLKEQAEREPKK